ncbi:hypothetical protein GN956_G14972 [Arapaima gigas]
MGRGSGFSSSEVVKQHRTWMLNRAPQSWSLEWEDGDMVRTGGQLLFPPSCATQYQYAQWGWSQPCGDL